MIAVMKVKKIRQKIHSAFAPPLSSLSRNTSPMIEKSTIRYEIMTSREKAHQMVLPRADQNSGTRCLLDWRSCG